MVRRAVGRVITCREGDGCLVRKRHPPVITDAEPSLEAEQRRRKRIYTMIMSLHILGFLIAVALAWGHLWWWALVVLVIAAPLRFVAALVTNAGSAERTRRRFARWEHRDHQ